MIHVGHLVIHTLQYVALGYKQSFLGCFLSLTFGYVRVITFPCFPFCRIIACTKFEIQIIYHNFVVCTISVCYDFSMLLKQSVSPIHHHHNDVAHLICVSISTNVIIM